MSDDPLAALRSALARHATGAAVVVQRSALEAAVAELERFHALSEARKAAVEGWDRLCSDLIRDNVERRLGLKQTRAERDAAVAESGRLRLLLDQGWHQRADLTLAHDLAVRVLHRVVAEPDRYLDFLREVCVAKGEHVSRLEARVRALAAAVAEAGRLRIERDAAKDHGDYMASAYDLAVRVLRRVVAEPDRHGEYLARVLAEKTAEINRLRERDQRQRRALEAVRDCGSQQSSIGIADEALGSPEGNEGNSV